MRIIDIEYKHGSTELTNSSFAKKFPNYNFKRFEKNVGINKRFRFEKNEDSVDLGIKTAKILLERNKNTSIDFLIFVSQSPRYHLPSSACIIQNELNLNKNIGAIDVNLGCSGYTYALSLAKGLIQSKNINNCLIITSDGYSKYLNEKDLVNNLIFSDAATATIVSNSDFNYEFVFGTDGSGSDHLIVKNGCTFDKEINPEVKYQGENIYTDNDLYMNGSEIFNFTSEEIPKLIHETLKINNLNIEDIDYFVLHQANKILLKNIAIKSKISLNKIFVNLEAHGNTVSSTIPIALKDIKKQILGEKTLLLAGFGVGLSMCATVIKF